MPYNIQTLRGAENFPITGIRTSSNLIHVTIVKFFGLIVLPLLMFASSASAEGAGGATSKYHRHCNTALYCFVVLQQYHPACGKHPSIAMSKLCCWPARL